MSAHDTRTDRGGVPIIVVAGQRPVAEALTKADYRVIDTSRDDAGQKVGTEAVALILLDVGDDGVDGVRALRRCSN